MSISDFRKALQKAVKLAKMGEEGLIAAGAAADGAVNLVSAALDKVTSEGITQ